MPLPSPGASESQDDFVARCMQESDLPTENDQRLSACFDTFRESRKSQVLRALRGYGLILKGLVRRLGANRG